MMYKYYISDVLMSANNNLLNMTGGTKITASFRELLEPKKEDNRTSQDVIDSIKDKMSKIR